MGKRYTRFAQWRKSVFERMTPVHWLVIVVVFAVTIQSIILSFMRPEPDPKQDESFVPIIERGALRVGVRTDIVNFGLRKISEDGEEEWTGLEVDLAHALAEEIYGDPNAVEFIPLDYTTRIIKTREDVVDCILTLSPGGFWESFVYSQAYYTDAVGIVVLQSGPVSLTGIQNASVGVMMRPAQQNPGLAHEGARTVLEQYRNTSPVNIVLYSNAPDMFAALRRGDIKALAMENALIPRYFDESAMRLLPDGIGVLPYCMAALPKNTALVQLADQVFMQMREDGRMAALYKKYQLIDYATVVQP